MLVKCKNYKFDPKNSGQHGHNHLGDSFTPGPPPQDMINNFRMSASEAYEIVKSESYFDSDTKLNIATFVTTWMEPTTVEVFTGRLKL